MVDVATGPIPGENFTSDPRNYPWHRPPDFTDLDEALKAASKKIFGKETSRGLLTMMEMGVPITVLTSAFVLSGIGGGKWTPDYALLLAGPVSHMMVLLAKSEEIDYKLGIEETVTPPGAAYFKEIQKENAKVRTIDSIMPEVKEKVSEMDGGFLAMAKSLASEIEDVPTEGQPTEQPMPMAEEGIV